MFPVLFHVGTVPVQAYGFFIALGYIAALALTRRLALANGLKPGDFSDLCFLCLVVGLLGARILFVLINWPHFSAYPSEIVKFWNGGLVFYGGFLLVLPSLLLFFRAKKIPVALGLDTLAPGLALGHAFGRLGCFAAGCCHGSYCEYPWGIALHSDLVHEALRGLPLHPTQLYEAAGLLLITVFLVRWSRRRPKAGSIALGYVLSYAALRFVVEWFRGDSERGMALGISTSQLVALALLIGGGALWIRRFRRDH